MSSLSAIIFFLYNFYIHLISGQFTPHTLCLNRTARIEPGTAGSVQYNTTINNFTTSSSSCSLNLTGFKQDGNVSLPGLDPMETGCQSNISRITVNNASYCITLENSNNLVILPTREGTLVMTLETRPFYSFHLNYYSNGKLYIINI